MKGKTIPSAERRRTPRSRSWSAYLPLLAVAGLAGFGLWQNRENSRAWQRMEAEREALEAVRREQLAVATFDEVYEQCSEVWREGLAIYWEPSALVWSREGLIAYFIEGADASSLRQVLCDAQGTRRGPRVARPLVELLPVEMAESSGTEPQGNADHEGAGIRGVRERFNRARLEAGLLAVELLAHPHTNQALVRRWRGLEGGAQPEVEPAEAPPFPLLLTGQELPLAQGIELPRLRELERLRWIEHSEQAFARIAEVLPEGAGISELTLSADKIEITIAAPTPAFDGKPPAPFGSLDLDEYGVAEQSWWYPYEEAGFGCARGRPLSEVRRAFAQALARFAGGKPQRAWYSCGPAYSDGSRGVWHLT